MEHSLGFSVTVLNKDYQVITLRPWENTNQQKEIVRIAVASIAIGSSIWIFLQAYLKKDDQVTTEVTTERCWEYTEPLDLRYGYFCEHT